MRTSSPHPIDFTGMYAAHDTFRRRLMVAADGQRRHRKRSLWSTHDAPPSVPAYIESKGTKS